MGYLTEQNINDIKNGELGSASTEKFMSILSGIKNGITVDIGVCEGKSSSLMLNNSIDNNVKVYGIDPIPYFNTNHPNYTYIKNDSVKIGQEWDKGPVDLVFFDSVHAKEQVLCELLYWWDLIKEGGYALFHDTSWLDYIHKEGHHGAGRKPGNSRQGFDSYGGKDWDTADKAVNEFFKIDLYPYNACQGNRVFYKISPPSTFTPETTTVWSFPDRGDWAYARRELQGQLVAVHPAQPDFALHGARRAGA